MGQTAFAFMKDLYPAGSEGGRPKRGDPKPTIRGWQVEEGPFRYLLGRDWSDPDKGDQGKLLGVVGLNPSTATADKNDATVSWCTSLGRALGYDGLVIGNLYGYRTTDPSRLRGAADPIGPACERHLFELAARCTRSGGRLVVAWGAPLPVPRQKGLKLHPFWRRADAVLAVLLAGGEAADGTPPALYCLELTKDGHPHHPRGVSNGTPLKPFSAQLADVRCRHCGTVTPASTGARAIADHLLACEKR